MQGLIFLHGGGCCLKQIKNLINTFVKDKKYVTVLFDRFPGKLLTIIKQTWLEYSDGRTIRFIVPKSSRLTPGQIEWINKSDAIFINGGDTGLYHQIYTKEKIQKIINRRFRQGANIAGSSAGALILPNKCIISGNASGTKTKSFTLSPLLSSAKQNSILKTGRGLGIIPSLTVDVHGAQWGRLPRLLEAMKQLKSPNGLMLDEDTIVVINPNKPTQLTTMGKGRVYTVKTLKDAYLVSAKPA